MPHTPLDNVAYKPPSFTPRLKEKTMTPSANTILSRSAHASSVVVLSAAAVVVAIKATPRGA